MSHKRVCPCAKCVKWRNELLARFAAIIQVEAAADKAWIARLRQLDKLFVEPAP